jgi:hypothetical protein
VADEFGAYPEVLKGSKGVSVANQSDIFNALDTHNCYDLAVFAVAVELYTNPDFLR